LDGEVTKPSLADARLYLCTDARRDRGDLPDFLDAVLSNGVDIVQLRDKNLETSEELDLLEVFADACRRHGAFLSANDRADVAVTADVDILHVGQQDLSPQAARRIVGRDMMIGRSSHSIEQATAAASADDLDYFCLGPVWSTPTKPGRPGIGLDPIRLLAGAAPSRPWFAIGGIDESTVAEVIEAGARRVVVVRVITEAEDPGAAAARLAARLRHGRA
jgi:thiamine-phosphate pyrophosphorylase